MNPNFPNNNFSAPRFFDEPNASRVNPRHLRLWDLNHSFAAEMPAACLCPPVSCSPVLDFSVSPMLAEIEETKALIRQDADKSEGGERQDGAEPEGAEETLLLPTPYTPRTWLEKFDYYVSARLCRPEALLVIGFGLLLWLGMNHIAGSTEVPAP